MRTQVFKLTRRGHFLRLFRLFAQAYAEHLL
jgi:hypothetical protein